MIRLIKAIKLMSVMSVMSLGSLLVFPDLGWAYLLPSKSVLEKLSDNHGSGQVVIQLEVHFSNAKETFVVKESWAVENELNMRLIATAEKSGAVLFKMHQVYKDGVVFKNNPQQKKQSNVPSEFFQNMFFARNSDFLIHQLKGWQILPPEYVVPKFNNSSNAPNSPNAQEKYPVEPFLRLARASGVIAYAFGEVSREQSESLPGGLWVEQDNFVIRKLRLPTQVVVLADDYREHARGIKFPKEITLNWEKNSVIIKEISISTKGNFAKSVMQTEKLEPFRMDGLQSSSLKDVVLEFYSRFR